jgi:gamma-glutamyltranspeptidase / glutathione hydrolase
MMRDFSKPQRSVAIAENGMAATSVPAATMAALDMLRNGGNAVDAAIAAVAMLSVIEPAMTGIGGDCFALYSPRGGMPVALNGSGRAPAAATTEWYGERGFIGIPVVSPHAVTVPGAVDAWLQLHGDHGRKDIGAVLAPAIKAAEEGFRVTPRVAYDWMVGAERLRHDPAAAQQYLPGGAAPVTGDLFRHPALGATLRRIARDGRAAFYEGEVASEIVACLRKLGGLQTVDDFAAQRCDYVTPISTAYRGTDVFECPPGGQGIIALVMLRTLSGYDLASTRWSEADRIHLLAEATKAAYALRDAYLCDPDFHRLPIEDFLSEERAARTRAAITLERALPVAHWEPAGHRDTTYLCVVDRDRNAVSLINSIFNGFGSGIHAPRSGVLLHNRGSGFRTTPGHPNAIAPRKRPMHTIIPAMAMKEGRAVMPFGVMGADYQAVGHVHLLSEMLDRGRDPQQAIDAPRSHATSDALLLEPTISREVAADLARRGHRIEWVQTPLGGAQAIEIDWRRGVLIGASEPRKDGCALGY